MQSKSLDAPQDDNKKNRRFRPRLFKVPCPKLRSGNSVLNQTKQVSFDDDQTKRSSTARYGNYPY